MANNYQVKQVKKAVEPARLTIIITIHGNGDRLPGLARNMDNLDWQEFKQWRQVIIIDHSPAEVVAQIEGLVEQSQNPGKREILWLNGGQPTADAGRTPQNEGLKRCSTEYVAVHCDDNFVSRRNYAAMVKVMDKQPDLDFVFSGVVRVDMTKQNKTFLLLADLDHAQTDLGAPVFRLSSLNSLLPDGILGIPAIYQWDWLLLDILGHAGARFTHYPKFGYIWARNTTFDWKPVVDIFGDVQTNGLCRNARTYPGWTELDPSLIEQVQATKFEDLDNRAFCFWRMEGGNLTWMFQPTILVETKYQAQVPYILEVSNLPDVKEHEVNTHFKGKNGQDIPVVAFYNLIKI
jgi:hypothetical protein